jgi:arylsulfatase A-like enzyme
MHAMVNYVDNDVGTLVTTLKATGMWSNTLLVFHADNGGEIMAAGVCGGNNWQVEAPLLSLSRSVALWFPRSTALCDPLNGQYGSLALSHIGSRMCSGTCAP